MSTNNDAVVFIYYYDYYSSRYTCNALFVSQDVIEKCIEASEFNANNHSYKWRTKSLSGNTYNISIRLRSVWTLAGRGTWTYLNETIEIPGKEALLIGLLLTTESWMCLLYPSQAERLSRFVVTEPESLLKYYPSSEWIKLGQAWWYETSLMQFYLKLIWNCVFWHINA